MSLAEKKCVACEGGVKALTEAEAKAHLKDVPGWELKDNATWLFRRFQFKNFTSALAFVNQAGDIAEAEGHHPDITFGWGYAEFRIQTHSVGGLHENDFILAAKISINYQ
ncbi:MAG: 4a-hydroxytetrahydrobiopterin dehydratase [Alphaproteobacteria bacterium]|nr:4a-hydroxytetrahydrobiopterin dehydratase [Alphaproteobacteria bacterium]